MSSASMSPASVVSTPKAGHSSLANGSSSSHPKSSLKQQTNSNLTLTPPKEGSSRRLEIDSLVIEFQKKLGDKWDKYQIAVSLFLVGKLSRSELMSELSTILDKSTIRFHNQLLLANLANTLRDEPSDGQMSSAGFGNQLSQQAKKRKQTNKSSQYELLKKDILSMSIRERKRLKNITRESGKKGMINSTIAITRQATVPKVPILTNASDHPDLVPPNTNPQSLTAQWGQDILTGITTPLCTESYELPDKTNLKHRIIGIAREHGLVGGVNDNVANVLSLGLEYHLKGLLESAMDIVRVRKAEEYVVNSHDTTSASSSTAANGAVNGNGSSSAPGSVNGTPLKIKNISPSKNINNGSSNGNSNDNSKKRKRITLTIEDLYDTLESSPHLVEPSGPLLRLYNNQLKNDDDMDTERQIRARYNKNSGSSGTNGSVATGKSPKKAKSLISYLLKPTGDINSSLKFINGNDKNHKTAIATPGSAGAPYIPPPNLHLSDKTIGGSNDLNWLIDDLLTDH